MPKRLKNIHLSEVSLVDNPANKGATVSLFKREPVDKAQRDGLVKVCKNLFDNPQTDFREAVREEMRDNRIFEVMDRIDPELDGLRESVVASAANLEGEERDQKIRDNVEQFLASVQGKLNASNGGGDSADVTITASDNIEARDTRGLVKRLAAHFGLLKADDPAGSPGDTQPSTKEATMPDTTEKGQGDLETQVSQLTEERDSLITERDALTKQAEAHGLTVTKADDGSVTLAKADDETVTDPDGNTVRKSEVGEAQFNTIKSMANRLSSVEKERQREQFAKRAEDELPNLGGDPMGKGDILAAVEACDEATRDAIKGHLDTLNKLMGEQFREQGRISGDSKTEALGKLDSLADERVEKTGESKEVAYAAVLKTDQGAELYNQHLAERAN